MRHHFRGYQRVVLPWLPEGCSEAVSSLGLSGISLVEEQLSANKGSFCREGVMYLYV